MLVIIGCRLLFFFMIRKKSKTLPQSNRPGYMLLYPLVTPHPPPTIMSHTSLNVTAMVTEWNDCQRGIYHRTIPEEDERRLLPPITWSGGGRESGGGEEEEEEEESCVHAHAIGTLLLDGDGNRSAVERNLHCPHAPLILSRWSRQPPGHVDRGGRSFLPRLWWRRVALRTPAVSRKSLTLRTLFQYGEEPFVVARVTLTSLWRL
ncbi:hypothetical protein NHX12_004210 [Muraenolepis orangiensis]|uniref:Uncharacterized protein n=1 Tax=Muraenolepis orangiensis TaxID=630683 RepID=A0A9Q0DXB8_9TELE|nr:hypothetical protein NHX12_004210 [Muraenolepis orangiensis]